MFVVVTTFYTLEGMKSILLPEFVFFSFKATPFTSKIQIYYSVVYSIIFIGVALHIITCPAPFTQGSLWFVRPESPSAFPDKHCFCGYKSEAPHKAGQSFILQKALNILCIYELYQKFFCYTSL